jgi:hypothetical protein
MYLIEMRSALDEAVRVLRRGGHLVLIIGNNTVAGQRFSTAAYVAELAAAAGLSLKLALVDHIRSRGLMTKRNKTAGLITREFVFVFKKGSK